MRLLPLLCLAACGFPRPPAIDGDAGGPDAPVIVPGEPMLLSFDILAARNAKLPHDLHGRVDQTAHTVSLEATALAGEAFAPTFMAQGKDVEVAGVAQTSGSSLQDFSLTPKYTVVGSDDTSIDYTVQLTNHTIVVDPQEAATVATHIAVAAGDLDLDGEADFVVSDDDGNVYPRACKAGPSGTGAALCTASTTGVPLTFAAQPGELALIDLNGDGRPELIAGNGAKSIHAFAIAKNTSGSVISFASPDPIGTCGGNSISAFAFGDLDGDGDLDLVVASGTGTITECANKGTATAYAFDTTGIKLTANAMVVTGMAIADFDGDGRADIAVVDGSAQLTVFARAPQTQNWAPVGSVTLGAANASQLVRRGDRLFIGHLKNPVIDVVPIASAPLVTSISTGSVIPDRIALGDFDRDGAVDVTAAANAIHLYLGAADGSFVDAPVATSLLNPAQDVAVGDFDHDGLDDVVLLNPHTMRTARPR